MIHSVQNSQGGWLIGRMTQRADTGNFLCFNGLVVYKEPGFSLKVRFSKGGDLIAPALTELIVYYLK
jgi:hypothetical protein